MRDALARKLAVMTDLTEGDRHALAGLVGNERDVKAGRSIILEGDDPRFVHLMLDGLTSVHVSRRVGAMRDQGLISWSRGRVTILDLPGLQSLADFDPNYLHTPRSR